MVLISTEYVVAALRMIGFAIDRQGDQVGITPADSIPPGLRTYLREHKAKILQALEMEEAGYLPGCMLHPLLAWTEYWWREIPPPEDVPEEFRGAGRRWFESTAGQISSIA